jgi:hypothetical protein
MRYEYFDLGMVIINLLFCGLLLHRQNKLTREIKKVKNLAISCILNPKLSRKRLKEQE